MSRARAKFTESDVRRCLSAARKAGANVRVEIEPATGKIVIVTAGAPSEGQSGVNPWDKVLDATEQKRSA